MVTVLVNDVSGFTYKGLCAVLGNVEGFKVVLKTDVALLRFDDPHKMQELMVKLTGNLLDESQPVLFKVPRRRYHPLINKGLLNLNSAISELTLKFTLLPKVASKRGAADVGAMETATPTKKRVSLDPRLVDFLVKWGLPFQTKQIKEPFMSLTLSKKIPSDQAWTMYCDLNQIDPLSIAHSIYLGYGDERIICLVPHWVERQGELVTGLIDFEKVPFGFEKFSITKLTKEFGLKRFICPPLAHTAFIDRPDLKFHYYVDSTLLEGEGDGQLVFDMGLIAVSFKRSDFRTFAQLMNFTIIQNLWVVK